MMVRNRDPEKREKFLLAALKLFVNKGVQNTSTADIAQEAGTAAGTLFLYFPTKQDLIHELILKIGKEQSEYIKTLLNPSLSAREKFSTIWNGSIRWFLENPEAYQYVQQTRDSGMIKESVVQETTQYFSYYYDAIQKGLQEGSIQPYPVEIIGGILYQDIVAVMNLIRGQSDPSQQEELIQIGFQIFWDGIKTDHAVRRELK